MILSRRTALGLLGSVAVALVGGCGMFGKSITFRYRLTVEVDTSQGVKSGSSVIQIEHKEQNGLQGSHLQSRMTGEAVAVALPNGKTLFALLDGSPMAAITDKLPERPSNWYELDRTLKDQKGVFDVPRTVANFRNQQVNAWPTLVTFGNIADPKTVVQVDPDNAAAALGAGVRIRRLTVEMTDDDVTTGIEKRFPWWIAYRDRHFDGTSTVSEDMTDKNIAAHLTSGSFSTEYLR